MRERLTPPEGDCLLGHKIPGGVRIGVSMRSLLRDKVAFAPDPEVFRPERWLECEAQVMQRMERVHELVFNWGFTRCLGINLASMMSSKFFVEVSTRLSFANAFNTMLIYLQSVLGGGTSRWSLQRPHGRAGVTAYSTKSTSGCESRRRNLRCLSRQQFRKVKEDCV